MAACASVARPILERNNHHRLDGNTIYDHGDGRVDAPTSVSTMNDDDWITVLAEMPPGYELSGSSTLAQVSYSPNTLTTCPLALQCSKGILVVGYIL
jgi:hypothetical protein